jgi:hypothetical protein
VPSDGSDVVNQPPEDQGALCRSIEEAFSRADRQNLRAVTRDLAGLIARLTDGRLRARYEGALDALPDMVRHGDGREA